MRNGQHKRVICYALASHPKAPCAGVFEEPTDHYYLIVWFLDTAKPTDLAFHRRFYNWVHGKEWKSEKIQSVRAILQYIRCEPRQLTELYCNEGHVKFMKNCWETRGDMQEKIAARDAKRAAKAIVTRVNIADENDWWVQRNMNPQAIVSEMIKHAIKDVNKFLIWLNYDDPDATMGSFIFHREKPRLEKEINMCVRRHWLARPYWKHLEARREQIEDRVEKGQVMTVEATAAALEDILKRNGMISRSL